MPMFINITALTRIALLDGRDVDTFKQWLKNHKRIRLVARDRAIAYASAINEILPECIQVADRFHLLQNLLDYLKEIFKDKMPAERLFKSMNYDNSAPLDEQGNQIMFDNKKRDLNSSQYKALAENRKKTTVNLSAAGVLSNTWGEKSEGCRRGIRDRLCYGKKVSSHDSCNQKKCKVAFMPDCENFNLSLLV